MFGTSQLAALARLYFVTAVWRERWRWRLGLPHRALVARSHSGRLRGLVLDFGILLQDLVLGAALLHGTVGLQFLARLRIFAWILRVLAGLLASLLSASVFAAFRPLLVDVGEFQELLVAALPVLPLVCLANWWHVSDLLAEGLLDLPQLSVLLVLDYGLHPLQLSVCLSDAGWGLGSPGLLCRFGEPSCSRAGTSLWRL